MATGFGALLDDVRAFYLERFRAAIHEAEADAGAEVVIEPPYLDDIGARVREGTLQLPCRGDLFVLHDGACTDAVLVDTEQMIGFDPLRFRWEGRLEVALGPFQWNMCTLALAPAPSLEQLAALVTWFERWFEDARAADPPFAGAVHYLSDAELEGGECRLALDLGSAPVEAFGELLDACGRAGAERVRVGQVEPVSDSAARPRRPRRPRDRNRRRR